MEVRIELWLGKRVSRAATGNLRETGTGVVLGMLACVQYLCSCMIQACGLHPSLSLDISNVVSSALQRSKALKDYRPARKKMRFCRFMATGKACSSLTWSTSCYRHDCRMLATTFDLYQTACSESQGDLKTLMDSRCPFQTLRGHKNVPELNLL